MDVDLGSLVIRTALGLVLIAHGLNKAVGPGALAGTTRWFESLGLRPPRAHARMACATELGAGALLLAGLLTGLATAACVGLMVVATLTDHRGKGLFVFKGGWEYTVFLAAVAVALAALGPGDASLDRALGLDLAGPVWALAAAVVGTAAALVLLAASYRPARQPAGQP
jgi:putative oxidoreductase